MKVRTSMVLWSEPRTEIQLFSSKLCQTPALLSNGIQGFEQYIEIGEHNIYSVITLRGRPLGSSSSFTATSAPA